MDRKMAEERPILQNQNVYFEGCEVVFDKDVEINEIVIDDDGNKIFFAEERRIADVLTKQKISVVIPTLQKNKALLDNLVKTLSVDNTVDEIIVIDNSCKGYSFDSDKLKVIVPEKNLYVNPSWNLGVKTAKNEIVALLNDDITIPEDFCKKVVSQINPDMGCVGFSVYYIKETQDLCSLPKSKNIYLTKVNHRCLHWGVAIFFYKTSYYEIPDDLKVYYGDDWLIYQNNKHNKKNYMICGQEICHYGSLSSNDKTLNPILKNDMKTYLKYTRKWWHRIFSIRQIFNGFELNILGIKITKHFR